MIVCGYMPSLLKCFLAFTLNSRLVLDFLPIINVQPADNIYQKNLILTKMALWEFNASKNTTH